MEYITCIYRVGGESEEGIERGRIIERERLGKRGVWGSCGERGNWI